MPLPHPQACIDIVACVEKLWIWPSSSCFVLITCFPARRAQDTYRGRVCECPVANGVRYEGDGYADCKGNLFFLFSLSRCVVALLLHATLKTLLASRCRCAVVCFIRLLLLQRLGRAGAL